MKKNTIQLVIMTAIAFSIISLHSSNVFAQPSLSSSLGDSGKGAGIGAVVGTMAGGRQAKQNKEAQTQQAQDAKAGTFG